LQTCSVRLQRLKLGPTGESYKREESGLIERKVFFKYQCKNRLPETEVICGPLECFLFIYRLKVELSEHCKNFSVLIGRLDSIVSRSYFYSKVIF
jgi:hypothetical protein